MLVLMQARLSELLSRYNVPGPRYTSYPTVPAWLETIGPSDYGASLRQLKSHEPLSLYFHLPFCERLCHFCGCMKVITKNRESSREYTDVLVSEIDRIKDLLPPGKHLANQIHFGGGSPNFFQPEEISEIMERVQSYFEVLPAAEIAIEMHPRTATKPFCDNLKALGFNRISLGIQDFTPHVQELIHRFQTYEQTLEMLDYLRRLGFDSFNFDLVYGLPGQTMAGWEKTLELVLGLRPNRLAVYSYAHVPWKHPIQRSFADSDLPPPELKLELFERAFVTFTQHGYRLIGMDHFALADDELSRAVEEGTIHRNFMGYTTQKDTHQIGMGVSAISYVAGNYFQNKKELPPYYAAIRAGSLATFRGFLLNKDDQLRRDLITRIMCTGTVDIRQFEQQWGICFSYYFSENIPHLQTFIDDNLLQIDERWLRVRGIGFLFLRNIAMTFDRYLEGIREEATTPTFSQTV